jgi:ceramide glucosyltransferase|uniref:Glycosyltransferase family 2 protein n=1 Tax=Desulfobacca acetoxidans TaxID=60893 RepID=A0A7C5EPG5_9BACT
MATYVLLGLMALVLAAFAGLLRVGGRALAWETPAQEENPPRWPRLALIVPVAGASPGLARRLAALLDQDYPDYQVVFATRDREDPATRVIVDLLRQKPKGRLVLSGPARTCGQKNANLLAGLKLAGEGPEILAFCDSNQEALPDFLRRLAAPLARGQARVASGYHHIIPGDNLLATWGRAVTVLVLHLTKAIPRLNQPWGGATAIRRDLFTALKVERLWGETVVDDVSLAARLIKARIPVAFPPGATLATPLSGETWASWYSWLFRQWIYLKYYLPGSWLAAGLFLHLTAALVMGSLGLLFLGLLGLAPLDHFWASLGFLGGLTTQTLILRRCHPGSSSPGLWLASSLAALLMASLVHLKTCLTQTITWRGLTYMVDWRGKVVSVREDPGP